MTEIDYSKVPEELKAKLAEFEKRNPVNRQLETLEDIAAMTQALVELFEQQTTGSSKQVDQLGALLAEMNTKLGSLNDKEVPETPDYAKPVVVAVNKIKVALVTAINGIRLDPEIKVNAPDVKVSAPDVDLKGVEKLLKNDLPKAFEKAVKLLPKTEIPPTDYTPLIEKLEELSTKLENIDTATRLKPQFPNKFKVTNPDGSDVNIKKFVTERYDYGSPPIYYVGEASVGTPDGSPDWTITKFDLTNTSDAKGKVSTGTSWANRVVAIYV